MKRKMLETIYPKELFSYDQCDFYQVLMLSFEDMDVRGWPPFVFHQVSFKHFECGHIVRYLLPDHLQFLLQIVKPNILQFQSFDDIKVIISGGHFCIC